MAPIECTHSLGLHPFSTQAEQYQLSHAFPRVLKSWKVLAPTWIPHVEAWLFNWVVMTPATGVELVGISSTYVGSIIAAY